MSLTSLRIDTIAKLCSMEEPDNFEELIAQAQAAMANCATLVEFENLRVSFLGDSSSIHAAQKSISELPREHRGTFGKRINEVRRKLEDCFAETRNRLEESALMQQLNSEEIDISLPGTHLHPLGAVHPLSSVTDFVVQIFTRLGFSYVTGPEVETEFYNFTALNTPEGHPARDDQDTFYTAIAPHVLLRSQTSPVQVRAMQTHGAPLRVITSGRVFRNEETNARKLPFFHQLEVLCIDEDISFANLKWTLEVFFEQLFGRGVKIRFRPDFFPFTEPSAEVDAQCPFCGGDGCTTCGGKGWLELLGCGMVDPNVLIASGLDPHRYSGFAAGLGLERLTMIKFGISDIRDLYTGDIRGLRQFIGANTT